MCVCSAVSIGLCLATGNPTTQHTNIMQAQLNHCGPPLSQEFPPILAQRILLTLENYETNGSVEPQKHQKLYFPNFLNRFTWRRKKDCGLCSQTNKTHVHTKRRNRDISMWNLQGSIHVFGCFYENKILLLKAFDASSQFLTVQVLNTFQVPKKYRSLIQISCSENLKPCIRDDPCAFLL